MFTVKNEIYFVSNHYHNYIYLTDALHLSLLALTLSAGPEDEERHENTSSEDDDCHYDGRGEYGYVKRGGSVGKVLQSQLTISQTTSNLET